MDIDSLQQFLSTPNTPLDPAVMSQRLEDRGFKAQAVPVTDTRTTPWDIMRYRLHKGIQNSFLFNLAGAFQINTADNEKLARFAHRISDQQDLIRSHPGVFREMKKRGTTEIGGLPGAVSEFAGMLAADPLTYTGLGFLTAARHLGVHPVKSAIGIGAGASALSDYLYQYVNNPQVKTKEVAIMAALGGALGGFAARAQPLSRGIGPTATAEDIPPAGPNTSTMPPPPSGGAVVAASRNLAEVPSTSIGVINDTLQAAGISLTPERLKSITSTVKANKRATDTYWAINAADKAGMDRIATLLDDPALNNFSDKVAQRSAWQQVADAWDSASIGAKLATKDKIYAALSRTKKNKPARTVVEEELAALYDSQQKLRESLLSLEQSKYYQVPSYQSVSDYFRAMSPKIQALSKETHLLPNTTPSVAVEQQIAHAYETLAQDATGHVTVDKLKAALATDNMPSSVISDTINKMSEEGKLLTYSRIDGQPAVYMENTLEENALKSATKALEQRQDMATSRIVRATQQAGNINPGLLKAAAFGTVGATLGYQYNGDEGAIAGAIVGGLLPWSMGKVVGKMNDWVANPTPEGVGAHAGKYLNDLGLVTRPHKQLEAMGLVGKQYVAQLDAAYDAVQLRVADALFKYNKALGPRGNLPKEVWEKMQRQIADVLEGKIAATGLDSRVIRAANVLRGEFKQIADDAAALGIWTPEDVAKMKVNLYFPRIYDEQLLGSAAGKKQFIDSFTALGWTEDGLINTLAAITGNKPAAARFVAKLDKNGDKVFVDRAVAEHFYNARKIHSGGASTHLDHQRKINMGQYDTLMDQFRIREPEKILDRYYDDVFTRLEHARIFGPKHEGMKAAIRKIEQETGQRRAADYAEQVYFNQIKDVQNSAILRAHMNAPDWYKTATGKIAAFEVLKLAYSQILQPTQAFVNGTAQLSRVMSLSQSFATTLRSLQKAMSNNPVWDEFAQRSASGLNVGLIDHISDITGEATLFGRSNFATNQLSWINTPAGFLRFIQFMRMEKFTQKWATIQGHALIEHLLSKKALIEEGAITDTTVIAQVRNIMEELGFDWSKSSKGFSSDNFITVKEKQRAAMRFNRAVNFTDGERQLPHTTRSPYAKMFRMYKTFAYRQSAFINDVLIKEGIKKGNFRPVVAYLAAAAPAGWTVNHIRDFIRADDRQYSNLSALLNHISIAGGYGLLTDLGISALKNEYSIWRTLVGPGIGDVKAALGALPDLALAGDIKPLARAAYQAFPELPGGLKRLSAEDAGLVERRKNSQRARTFRQELLHAFNIADREKKRTKSVSNIPLNVKMDLGLD